MNAQELLGLQEAYLGLYEAVDDEGRSYGERTRPIVRTKLPDHMKSPNPRPVKTYAQRRAINAAKTPQQKEEERQQRMKLAQSLLRQPQQEQVDIYDIILSHLLDEGYANTPEEAQVILDNMSEGWKSELVKRTVRAVGRGAKRTAKRSKREAKKSVTNPVKATAKRATKRAGRFALMTALGVPL